MVHQRVSAQDLNKNITICTVPDRAIRAFGGSRMIRYLQRRPKIREDPFDPYDPCSLPTPTGVRDGGAFQKQSAKIRKTRVHPRPIKMSSGVRNNGSLNSLLRGSK